MMGLLIYFLALCLGAGLGIAGAWVVEEIL